MSEENMNEDVVSSEVTPETEVESAVETEVTADGASEAVGAAEEAVEAPEAEAVSGESEEVAEAVEDGAAALSPEEGVESVDAECSELEAADEAAEGAAEESTEAAEEAAEESAEAAEEPVSVDLSKMSWEERVEYFMSLETVEGYVKALRLVDFHNPGDFQIAETWNMALQVHPEMALDIYRGVARFITSDAEVWSGILQAHETSYEMAAEPGQEVIKQVMGMIKCLRLGAADEGRAYLSENEGAKDLLAALDEVSTGNWRKVEVAVEGQLKAMGLEASELPVEQAQRMADLALSAGSLDRAVQYIKAQQRKSADDLGLKWRLAILSRDQKKWPAYVDVMNKELINATDAVEEKVDIYNEMIRVYRDETKQEGMVVKTYEALLSIDPDNRDALENIVAIYEKLKKWPDLIKTLESQTEGADDERKVELYLRIANIYLSNMNRKVDAIKYFENVLSVDATHEESIMQLKTLYTERRDYASLIEVHKKELSRIDSLPDQIDLLKAMAEIAEKNLRNNGVAIEMWAMILERDGENAEAIDALEKLYEKEKMWSELASVSEKRIELTPDESEKFELLQKLGVLYSTKAKDLPNAVSAWRRVLAIDPSYAKGVDSLRKLLIEMRDWEALEAYYTENGILSELVTLFEQLSKTQPEAEDKKAVLLRAAHVYENSLNDSDSAMATLEKILEIDAKDAVAAGELAGYYEPRHMYAELAQMLEILYDSCEAGEARSAYGLRLAQVCETKLSDDKRAYSWYHKVVTEDAHYVSAFDGLERTSGKTGQAQVVVDLYRKNLESADDADYVRELRFRIGKLLFEYLDKSNEAQDIFRGLLDEDPEDVRAIGALENILEREGRFDELLDYNTKRMELAKSPEDKAETLLMRARINEHQRGDKDGAIQAYEQVCELLPEDVRPLVELHRLYAETESPEQLSRIIEKQLELLGANESFSETRSEAEVSEEGLVSIVYGARLERTVIESEDGEAEKVEWVERACSGLDAEKVISLWSELGDVYRNSLSEYEAAVECYDSILLLDIEHQPSIEALEGLLENEVSVAVVCRALSRVYVARENYEGLANVLVKLAGALTDSRDKISYLICASQINREILENADATLECLSAAQLADPACETVKQSLMEIAETNSCWERVISIFENVANSIPVNEDGDNLLATQYAIDLSVLWESQLANNEKAIEYGRKALQLGSKNAEVLEYLQESMQRLESWSDVIEVLKAKRDLVLDDEEAVLSLNMQIASIQENCLNQNEEAINTLLEVLDVHSDNQDAMIALDRLYASTEKWSEAVANYERRLELTEDEASRHEIECHRAEILSQHLNEADSALDIYSSVIASDPSNALAVSGLETMLEASEGSIAEQISDILLPIYDANENWEKRCWVDEQLLRVVIEPDRRRDLLHEIASLCEERGGDHERAYDAYARSLKEDLTSETTINSLINYADALDKWADLVKVMEDATVEPEDVQAAKNIRVMVANIYSEHLGDVDAAIRTYSEIRELDPEDVEILDALISLYHAKEDWKNLSEVITAKAELVSDPDERKQLLFQAAAIYEDSLEDVESAIAIHNKILVDEAGEPEALNALERLYLGQERWKDLLDVYDQKIEIAADDDERIALYKNKGILQEGQLEDNVGAIETYQQVLAINPDDPEALEALDRLYLGASEWTSLLEILERREAICTDDAERVEFKFRQAECDYRNLDDIARAIEVYNSVLELDPAHERSIASLEEIIGLGGENSAEAARVLVPIYQGLGRAEALVKVYEVLVSSTEDPAEAIELLSVIGQIEEDSLQNNKAAFDAWYRALAHDPTRGESWETVERLAASCDCYQELVDKLDTLKTDLSSDSEVCIIIAKHMASIYEGNLQAPEKAVDVLRGILDIDSDEKEAIQSLDHLYESLERWNDLSDILQTEIDIAESDEERLQAFYRRGAVQEQCLGNFEEAVNSYNEMLMIVPGQPEAIESLIRIFSEGNCCSAVAEILDPIYRDNAEWEQLVALDLQLVDHLENHDERYDKLVDAANVYLDEMQAIPEALDTFGRALVERPGDDLCLTKMDELSEIVQSWAGNIPYLQKACEASEDDLVKQDLTLRMARTYYDKLEDLENAERCFLDVLKFDEEHLESLEALDRIYLAQTRYEDLVAVIRREIPLVDSDDQRIELNMRLGAILFEMLQKGDDAIAAYEEVLNIEPGYWDALVALETIYASREDWKSVYETYDKMAASSNDDNQRVELWSKQALLASETLNHPDDAINLWYQIIDVLGDNIPALQNLEVLFTRSERWTDVAEIVERQVPLYAETQDADNHLEAYRKLGRIYRDKLEDNDRSRDYWRNALDVNGSDLESLRAIEALDEAMDDQEDLADNLLKLLNAGILSQEEQLASAVKLAGVRDGLGRVDDTIEIWLYVLQIDPTYMDAYKELERLYENEGRWTDVIATLGAKSDVVPDVEDKVALWMQIAKIWETQEFNVEQAAAAYSHILAIDPARDSAFELLEQLYTDNEKWPELLNAYIERAATVSDPAPRLDLTFRASKTAEDKLQDPSTAFDILLSTAPEFWKDAKFHDEIQRLAEVAQTWPNLVEVYAALAEDADNNQNREDSLKLHNYLGGWFFTRLHQPDVAWQHLSFVTEQDPSNISARDIMADCFEQMGHSSIGEEAQNAWFQQVNVLAERLELTLANNEERVNVLLRIGRTFEEHINDLDQAESAYTQAHSTVPERLDAMVALARVYEKRERWNELVAILEEEVSVIEDDDEKCNTLNHNGEILEAKLNDYQNALSKYNAVLAIDPQNKTALVGAERLDAGLGLWKELLDVYDLQLAAFEADEERIAVYAKKSQVYETQLNDLNSAIDMMTQVTLIDSSNVMGIEQLERLYELAERWPDLIDEMNTHISVVDDPATHVELYRRLGAVFRDKVGDAASAIDSFQNLISIQTNDIPALYALADLYQAGEDYVSAIDYLNRVIGCLSDPAEATDVHYRIGIIYAAQLQDDVTAEERLKICLDINAGYMPAIDALKIIYENREDWQNVVRILKQKVEFTRELDEKAQINCELGFVSLNRIGDPVNAYPYYEEALSLQPDYVDAALPLADKCLAEESWARALLLMEIVIKGIAFRKESDQLYLFNYKAGYCCQKLAQHERALEFYRASYELNQNFVPTLLGMGQELKEARDYDRSWNMFQNLLENFAADLTPENVIDIYYDSAEIKKETGEPAMARQLLERILEADGSHQKALDLIIDVCEEMEDYEALVYYLAIHMDRLEDKDDKFLETMKIAKIYGENLNNVQEQVRYYYMALELEPTSKVVLNALLTIYHNNRQWDDAINIIERLCDGEPNEEKVAKYYYTIAVIYRDEVQNVNKAIEYFNLTLDTNVNELRAFEAIDRLLTAARDWDALEHNYRKMIKRVNDDPSDQLKDTRLLLWYGLGEIYRTRLGQWDNAIQAFKIASEINPKDIKLHSILAELYRKIGSYNDAIEEIRKIILNPSIKLSADEMKSNYRMLFLLYYNTKQFDRAYCVAEVMNYKDIADDDVQQLRSIVVPDEGFQALNENRRINADALKLLTHAYVNADLNNIIRNLQPLKNLYVKDPKKDYNIQRKDELKCNNDLVFWKIFNNISRVIGMNPTPAVYRTRMLNYGGVIANLKNEAFMIAETARLNQLPQRQLAFILSKLCFLYSYYPMAGIQLGGGTIKELIVGCFVYFQHKAPTSATMKSVHDEISNLMELQRKQLEQAMAPMLRNEVDMNVSTWLKGVEFTCNRVGLLLSGGDLQAAINCIDYDENRISKVDKVELKNDLVNFAMSDAYFELREGLDIAYGSEE